MKFLVIHKDKIYNIPPLISAMYILRDLGHDVKLVTCGISEQLYSEFVKRGISYTILPMANATSPLAKIYEYVMFRREVKKIIEKEKESILWIEGANTIRSLGTIIQGFKYILQISELHEKSKPQLRAIGKVIHGAQIVFMPENSRTSIYQAWFKLERKPVVLPNKPYFVPQTLELEDLKSKYSDIVRQIEGKKIVLYQGYIGYDRDISAIVKAVKQMGDDFLTVVVGKDCGILKDYQKLDERIIHINFMPAPDYLLFTSMAYIGILTYTPDCLNNLFCAPNKIYEYTAFGLPMIGNDIPGLKVLEYEGAGQVVDLTNEESVIYAIKNIDKNYEAFSNAAKALFDKTDNKETIKNALDNIEIIV